MYAGHVGLALAFRAERAAPPLALLVLAAQGPDWAESALEAAGVRWRDPTWSPHGLIFVGVGVALAACIGALAGRARQPRARTAVVAGLAYASHWLADYFTGHKPTWPGGPLVGLGLYEHPVGDLVLESAVVLAGWWLWHRALPERRSGDRRGHAIAWGLLATLLALQLAADLVMIAGVQLA